MEKILSEGLRADDFVQDIQLEYGETRLYFHYAFCLVNENKGLLAIFTEHDGYQLFSAYAASVYKVHKEWVYTWSDPET